MFFKKIVKTQIGKGGKHVWESLIFWILKNFLNRTLAAQNLATKISVDGTTWNYRVSVPKVELSREQITHRRGVDWLAIIQTWGYHPEYTKDCKRENRKRKLKLLRDNRLPSVRKLGLERCPSN